MAEWETHGTRLRLPRLQLPATPEDFEEAAYRIGIDLGAGAHYAGLQVTLGSLTRAVKRFFSGLLAGLYSSYVGERVTFQDLHLVAHQDLNV